MTNSNEAEGKHKPSPKPVDSLDELVERLELWCTLREPLPTVKYSSVRELLAASLHYSRAALVQQCSHSALLAENAALQRQLELAEATHGDEAFAGALSDEMAKSRHEALTARCEKLEAALRQCRAELRRNLQRERDDIQRAWLQTAHDAASDALLSDEAAKMNDAKQGAAQEGGAFAPDAYTQLLAERDALLADLAACRGALKLIAPNAEAGEYETEYDGQMLAQCLGCSRNPDTGMHAADCTFAKAAALSRTEPK